jgi:hypothetical protein
VATTDIGQRAVIDGWFHSPSRNNGLLIAINPYGPDPHSPKDEQEIAMQAPAARLAAQRRIVGTERVTVTGDCIRRYRAGQSIRPIAV